MSQTLTSVLPLYKEHYAETISELFHNADGISPIFACFDSKANTGEGAGRKWIQRVRYSSGATSSATFATSQAKAAGTTAGSAGGVARFEIDAVETHGFAQISRQSIDGAEGKSADEQFDVLDESIADCMRDMTNQLSVAVVERGWGRIGTVTAVTSSTVTVDPSVCNRLEIGTDVIFAAAEATGVTDGTALRVTQIDSDTGIITLSGDPTGLTTPVAVGHTMCRDGDRETGASPAKLKVTGLRAWLDHTSASNVLHNVTRTGNEKLLGYKVDGTNLSRVDALMKMASKLHKNSSGESDTVFVSDEDFFAISADQNVIKNVAMTMGKYDAGFTGLSVNGPNGKNIKILSDSNLEAGIAYMGPWNNAAFRPYFFYNGKSIVNIDDHDGNTLRAKASSPDYEIRMYFRGNAVMPAPGKFGVIYNLGVTA